MNWYKLAIKNTKVTNPDGTPRKVFHGTEDTYDNIDVAKSNPSDYAGKGAYFTEDPEIASDYAMGKHQHREQKHPNPKPNVRPAYLDIQNPLDYDSPIDQITASKFLDFLSPFINELTPKKKEKFKQVFPNWLTSGRKLMININGFFTNKGTLGENAGLSSLYDILNKDDLYVLKGLGFDGVTLIQQHNNKKARTWVAINNEQIHSYLPK